MTLSRRELLAGAALASLSMKSANGSEASHIESKQRGRAAGKPVLVAAGNAFAYLAAGYEPDQPHTIAVNDGESRLEKTVSLFEGASRQWPPLVAPPPTNL
jgi:hypothetical protein